MSERVNEREGDRQTDFEKNKKFYNSKTDYKRIVYTSQFVGIRILNV